MAVLELLQTGYGLRQRWDVAGEVLASRDDVEHFAAQMHTLGRVPGIGDAADVVFFNTFVADMLGVTVKARMVEVVKICRRWVVDALDIEVAPFGFSFELVAVKTRHCKVPEI